MRRVLFLMLLMPCLLLSKEISIAVIAISGVEHSKKEWMPTLEYLQKALPQHHLKLSLVEPHNIFKLKKLIKDNQIDFVITQPAIYVELELDLGVSRILTMIKQQGLAEFGSVFITYQDSGIENLSDLKGKKVSAVAPLGFGGWLIGYNELLDSRIDPLKDGLVSFEGTQINVINAILDKKSQLGVIRTGMIEHLTQEGFKGLDKLRIINAQKVDGFPYLLSTKLYPEWALAKCKHTSNSVAKELATAFLTLSKDSPAAQSASYDSWTFPYNYQPVHELMKRLRVGPYSDYDTMSIRDIIYEYKYFFSTLLLAFSLLIYFLFYSKYMNKKLYLERELKNEALSHLETIFDIQESLLLVIKDDAVVKVNRAFLNFFGHPSLAHFLETKKSLQNYFEYVDDTTYISAKQNGAKWMNPPLDNKEMHYKVKISHRVFSINIEKIPLEEDSYIVILNDITYLEDNKLYLETLIELAKENIMKKERELFAQSKQAAMGEMISVIAHQLKQPLSVINILHGVTLMDIALGSFSEKCVKENIETATKQISFMSSTIDDFRNFFKPNKVGKTFPLEHCIKSVLNLLSPILRKAKISVIYEGDITIEIHSLENELFHVVMNIIDNAKDVLLSQMIEEPEIHIRVSQSKEGVNISIEDNAGGIEDTVIDKIFDQYFTTKEERGTGLGLYMSKMIVQESLGGTLCVENGDYGAKFTIIL